MYVHLHYHTIDSLIYTVIYNLSKDGKSIKATFHKSTLDYFVCASLCCSETNNP